MRFVIINTSNIVTNVVVAEEEFGLSQGWIPSETAGMGWLWVEGTIFVPPAPEPAPEPEQLPNHITVGSLKDRLGADALAIAVSTHPICVALREMLRDRKYIDLDRPQVGQFFDMLIAAQQPEENPIFPGSGPMTIEKKEAILSTSIDPTERP